MHSDHEQVHGNSAPRVSPEIGQVYVQVCSDPKVQLALNFIQVDQLGTLKEQIEITEIPAPSFQEETRGRDYQRRLQALGLQNVQMDREGNVFGIRPGSGNGPKLMVCAHLDTVFPEGTDTRVQEKDGVYYGPGIADDGRGLAVNLALIRALNHANLQTDGDILFCASVGEEGLGDLRGVKAFFDEHGDIDGFIAIEPGEPARVTYLATGSHRYQITFTGPGGHSFGDFGVPSAIHALGRAISRIADLQVPTDPKTTFTVGTVQGGTSVNSIAAEASMTIDLRSSSEQELLNLESQVLSIVRKSAVLEDTRWDQDVLQMAIKQVGRRPAGVQDVESPIVQAALAAGVALGIPPVLDEPSSTDANVPIRLGIPAITLGGGGTYGGAHTLQEHFDPADAYLGVQKIFLTMVGLVGIHGVNQPLLPRRAR